MLCYYEIIYKRIFVFTRYQHHQINIYIYILYYKIEALFLCISEYLEYLKSYLSEFITVFLKGLVKSR